MIGEQIDLLEEQIKLEEQSILKLAVERIISNSEIIMKNTNLLAEIDVASALAYLAIVRNYTRPLLVKE